MLYIAWLAREKPGFTIFKNFTAFLLPEQSMFKDLWKCLFVHHPLAGRREKSYFLVDRQMVGRGYIRGCPLVWVDIGLSLEIKLGYTTHNIEN